MLDESTLPEPAVGGYVFVCYAHDERDVVVEQVAWLRERGFAVWYDEAIEAGSRWSEDLARAIEGCAAFLYLLSPRSVASRYCLDEVHYALECNRPVVPVELAPVTLTPGLRLSIGGMHRLSMHRLSTAEFRARLERGLREAVQARDPLRAVERRAPDVQRLPLEPQAVALRGAAPVGRSTAPVPRRSEPYPGQYPRSASNDFSGPTSPARRSKFRVPRLRRSSVARPALLARLEAAVADSLIVAVVAPAGFGKTTLLVQFANAVAEPDRVVWMSLDADDDDPVSFIANLVEAVEPLGLHWRESPRELVANLAAGGRQGRAAVGALVDALDTAEAGRLVLVLDDLHRVSNPEVYALLETLVERAPDGFALVASSRTLPPLPIARWRIGGEAAEFGPADLAFGAADAQALAGLATGDGAAPVGEVIRRTRGWPAGTALMLRNPGSAPDGAASTVTASQRLLYDYLASEVLQGLPAELQSFAMDVSILAELTPSLCAAVTGHPDARAMLRTLYRQDLFVTAVDGTVPVLRMHDLFRDFLQARLEAAAPERLPLLHERAAEAEPSLPRAIGHCIAGAHWERALRLMAANADRLVEEGHRLAMQRWLEQVPEAVVSGSEQGLFLRGYGAWLRWDWLQARADMGALLERMRAAGREPPTRLLLFMSGFSSAVGAREEAQRLSAEIEQRALAPAEQATHSLQLAWRAMDVGDLPAVRRHFAGFVELAVRDPRSICPLIMDRNTAYIGLPGMLALYDRYLAAARGLVGPSPAPWHATVWILEAWTALWRGQREAAARAIETARELQQHFGGLTPTDDALARLEAVFHASVGEGERGLRVARPLVERFESPWAAGIKVVFERAYWAGVGKVAWMAGDAATLREVSARLVEPRRPQEWRFIDLVRATLPGQLAILERRWTDAERHLATAVELHADLRFPQGHPDPRICLAYVQAVQGQTERARAALEPVLDECLAEDSVGALVCEPPEMVRAALGALPESRRREPRLAALLARTEAWGRAPAGPRPAPGPLARLTDREREVLARVALGHGNKEIARSLDLSLHTVKRHIANILGKLDCVSRRQAADLYRQHAR